MSSKKIFLTRHGQTDYNKKGVVQGSGIDADLNDWGKAQGKAFYDHYQSMPFDKLYVSALKRTHQSMDGFIKAGLSCEVLPELNEISWGTREGMPIDEEGNAYYQRVIRCWREGQTDLSIEGGESPEEVALRLRKGLDYLMSKTNEKNVLVCMHGRSMRVLLTIMLNYPLKGMDMFAHSNLCLYKLTWSGSIFTVNRYNDTNHLEGIMNVEL